MTSRGTPDFWSLYRNLPAEIRQAAQRALEKFLRNPGHPGLQLERLRKDPRPPAPLHAICNTVETLYGEMKMFVPGWSLASCFSSLKANPIFAEASLCWSAGEAACSPKPRRHSMEMIVRTRECFAEESVLFMVAPLEILCRAFPRQCQL